MVISALIILPLPSVSPAIPDIEIPNSARTIGIIPFVFLLISMGFWQAYLFMLKFLNKPQAAVIIALFVFVAAFFNLNDYFVSYAKGLPENNLGPSLHISGFIDKNFDSATSLYFC